MVSLTRETKKAKRGGQPSVAGVFVDKESLYDSRPETKNISVKRFLLYVTLSEIQACVFRAARIIKHCIVRRHVTVSNYGIASPQLGVTVVCYIDDNSAPF